MHGFSPLAWALMALVGGGCVIAMLRAVASAVADEVRAHELAIRVAQLRIERLEQLREFERQRAAGKYSR
ncbi:MAG: hypothetical protein R3B57_10260 [Phycisphaerales bacterium]